MNTPSANHDPYTRAASLAEVQSAGGCLAVQLAGRVVALFAHDGQVYAVDNRCPHMGFPLDRGTVKEGILTCHWHHARFDLSTGGTFDQFAGDVDTYPVEVREGQVWVDLSPQGDPRARQRERLQVGLERDIPLVIAKAVIQLIEGSQDVHGREAFRLGLQFGARYRQSGWGQGLTMHTCMMNLLERLAPEQRPRALYHGLSAVARDTFGHPPRFPIGPLPGGVADPDTLKSWFRQFIEVRDEEGAERCLVSAVRAGAGRRQLADMLFGAATDHRYIQIGHVVDFTNKAFEALAHAGWESGLTELVLTSLVSGYANADRMEESNAWRHPVDLIVILEDAFEALPGALEMGQGKPVSPSQDDGQELVSLLHGDAPQATVEALLGALRRGWPAADLAGVVAYAAALRIARFHTSNEFTDWDTALHTFTFANAIHQGLKLAPSPELTRGLFDAAMSVYLDRFLNVPAARLPEPEGASGRPEALLEELSTLLDRQHQVNQAGELVGRYLFGGGDPDRLLSSFGELLLREDRDFHTIQTIEAAFQQYRALRGRPEGVHVMAGAARYLAAHSPTVRAQGQTYQIASRLHRGERLFEGD